MARAGSVADPPGSTAVPGVTGGVPVARQSAAWPKRLAIASVLLAIVPIVVATLRGIDQGWLPIGDNAYFAIRARDVFSAHPPLLGTWTSASLSLGRDVNNPGPLLFDVLALPVLVFGTTWGLAVGAGILNVVAVATIAAFARRGGGWFAVVVSMLVTALLCWSMGSEVLFDPWQPHSLVLPFLAYLVIIWALSCGDLVALPFAVGVGSLLVQTHLTSAYLVPILGLWGGTGLVLELRRRRGGAARGARALPTVVLALAVAGVCWLQPIVEQVTGGGDGNLRRLAAALGSGDRGPVAGIAGALRIVAPVLALPPWWLRPSFANALHGELPPWVPAGVEGAGVPSIGVAVAVLGVLTLVLVACGWLVRDERAARNLVVTSGVGLVAGVLTASRVPLAVFGVAPHQFRWLWPLGALIAFAVVVAVATALRPHRSAWRARAYGIVFTATAVVAVANLPGYNSGAGLAAQKWAIPVMRDLNRQLAALEPSDGPLLYDFRGITFMEPYTTPILAELQRRGVAFVVDEDVQARQLGEWRHDDGEARARIFYRAGASARTVPAGARRFAWHAGLGSSERRELASLEEELASALRSGRLHATDDGRAALASGDYPFLRRAIREHSPPPGFFESQELLAAIPAGLVGLRHGSADALSRYAELKQRESRETVAIFVAPLEG